MYLQSLGTYASLDDVPSPLRVISIELHVLKLYQTRKKHILPHAVIDLFVMKSLDVPEPEGIIIQDVKNDSVVWP